MGSNKNFQTDLIGKLWLLRLWTTNAILKIYRLLHKNDLKNIYNRMFDLYLEEVYYTESSDWYELLISKDGKS